MNLICKIQCDKFEFKKTVTKFWSFHSQNQNAGTLEISTKGLRVRFPPGQEQEQILTPFQNIAVWSAVKFVVSHSEGGAAFLPLITDPENIDKTILFKPLRYDLTKSPYLLAM
jgi:hypothetical protein